MERIGHRRAPAALVSIASRASNYWAGGRIASVNWNLTPIFLKMQQTVVEPSLAAAKADDKFQFERHGYFVADRVDYAAEMPVFNLAVGLKDSWGK